MPTKGRPNFPAAQRVVNHWWETYKESRGVAPTAQKYISVVKICEQLMNNGWSQQELLTALKRCTEEWGGSVSIKIMQICRRRIEIETFGTTK